MDTSGSILARGPECVGRNLQGRGERYGGEGGLGYLEDFILSELLLQLLNAPHSAAHSRLADVHVLHRIQPWQTICVAPL